MSSWEQFGEGNTAAEVHGARSDRRIAPLAESIAAELMAADSTPGHLKRAEFAGAVAAYARAEAVVRLLWDYLAEQDVVTALSDVTRTAEVEERGKTRTTRRGTSTRVLSVLSELHRAETRANSLRRELGLTPAAAGRLAKDLSASRWYQGATPLDAALDRIAAERERQAIRAPGDG